MIKHKKAAGCSNIQTAQLNIIQFYFTQFMTWLKVSCYRASAWINRTEGLLL
jgi:hypothetical protein